MIGSSVPPSPPTDENHRSKVWWQISLDTPPEIVRAGTGVHGRGGNERYVKRMIEQIMDDPVHGRGGNERYLMPHLWSLHLYPYPATVRVGDYRFPIRPGYAGIVPPDTPMEYAFHGVSQHLFVHFRCVAPGIREASPSRIPAMQDLGDDFVRRYQALSEMVGDVQRAPYRLQAHVWDLLGSLTAPIPPIATQPNADHPAVRHALRQIELRLAETLSVASLAREAGVSCSYLGRLFGQTLGTTVVGYIRERRLCRAEHLLRHSTLPIKTIAAAVGIPDLHLFNKSLRRTLGKSPTAVRAQGPDRTEDTVSRDAPELGVD